MVPLFLLPVRENIQFSSVELHQGMTQFTNVICMTLVPQKVESPSKKMIEDDHRTFPSLKNKNLINAKLATQDNGLDSPQMGPQLATSA